MPRRARLSLAGIPWHIIQRGNNRSVCFFADEDYRLYLDHLTELAERSKPYGSSSSSHSLVKGITVTLPDS